MIGSAQLQATKQTLILEGVHARLQKQRYVEKVGRQLRLTPAGRLLTMFLQLYFTQYVDYGFTSDMEAQLDSVSGGSAVSPCPVRGCFLCRCCCSCSLDGPASGPQQETASVLRLYGSSLWVASNRLQEQGQVHWQCQICCKAGVSHGQMLTGQPAPRYRWLPLTLPPC